MVTKLVELVQPPRQLADAGIQEMAKLRVPRVSGGARGGNPVSAATADQAPHEVDGFVGRYAQREGGAGWPFCPDLPERDPRFLNEVGKVFRSDPVSAGHPGHERDERGRVDPRRDRDLPLETFGRHRLSLILECPGDGRIETTEWCRFCEPGRDTRKTLPLSSPSDAVRATPDQNQQPRRRVAAVLRVRLSKEEV
jgi:hypothetical protein